jgi:adenylate kinase family enzyme
MKKIVIFGNSGSGKSTLAKEYVEQYGLSHLDLDTLAWLDTTPPIRKPLQDSADQISQFTERNKSWVIEGCYSDLLSLVIKQATEVIFLNPSVEICIDNCIARPWEPHKYQSAEQQNQNLEMLLDWVKQYPVRSDEFSLQSHQKLFNEYNGNKTQYSSNDRSP